MLLSWFCNLDMLFFFIPEHFENLRKCMMHLVLVLKPGVVIEKELVS